MDDILVFTTFNQGNVIASALHPAGPNNPDTNYSPLWQVGLVSWNPGPQGRVPTSQKDITDAASAGDVIIRENPNYRGVFGDVHAWGRASPRSQDHKRQPGDLMNQGELTQ